MNRETKFHVGRALPQTWHILLPFAITGCCVTGVCYVLCMTIVIIIILHFVNFYPHWLSAQRFMVYSICFYFFFFTRISVSVVRRSFVDDIQPNQRIIFVIIGSWLQIILMLNIDFDEVLYNIFLFSMPLLALHERINNNHAMSFSSITTKCMRVILFTNDGENKKREKLSDNIGIFVNVTYACRTHETSECICRWKSRGWR